MTGVLIVVIVLVLVFAIWFISISNKFNIMKVKIEEANAGIDVALQKRYDTLTKLVDVVKGYAKHEQETLTNVIELRQGMSVSEKANASKEMDALMGKVNVLVENYPDLKANTTYIELQRSIVDCEEHLQAARRLYNSNVTEFNKLLVVFPSSVVAGMKNLTKQDFFEVEEEKKHDDLEDFDDFEYEKEKSSLEVEI